MIQSSNNVDEDEEVEEESAWKKVVGRGKRKEVVEMMSLEDAKKLKKQ